MEHTSDMDVTDLHYHCLPEVKGIVYIAAPLCMLTLMNAALVTPSVGICISCLGLFRIAIR